MKEEFDKMAGMNAIAIECISTRLLEDWGTVKCMSAFNSILLPGSRVGTREWRNREERRGETDSKVPGDYSQDVINDNVKQLLGLAGDNTFALLKTFFCAPESGVSSLFQNAGCGNF